jgi:pimeloyl-ACP methyl ester carboxylesterase
MPYLDLQDGRLYYEERGEGRPLVLLHGAWASHRWWKWQIPDLSRLYRVVTMDMRGHGRSSDRAEGYPLQGYVEDLESLLKELGIHETAIVGWSMGGMVAMQFCVQYSRKVRALVLMATRGHRNPGMKSRIMFQYLRSVLHLLMEFTAPRKYDRTGAAFRRESKRRIEKETRKVLSSRAPGEVYEWMVSELTRHPRRNYLEIARGLWNWEAGEALRELQMPTLIMVGEKDPWTPPRFSRLLHEAIPGSRLLIVDGQKHYMAMETPGPVNTAILGFLREQDYT